MRILIVDDHEVVRRGVRSLLSTNSGFEVCGEAVDGVDAIAKATELRPDVITMDISMPNLNGLEAAREIRRILPDVHILFLSQHDVPEMLQQALNAGADGYVVKSAVSTNLVAALEKLRRGERSFDPTMHGSAHSAIDTQEILQRSVAFEKALRESEGQLQLALEASSTALFEWDILANRGQWNPQMAAIYGFTPEANEITSEGWLRLFHPDDSPRLLKEAEQTFRDKADFHFEFRTVKPDGSVRWILSKGRVVRDAAGKPIRLLGTHTDITQRKLAEERAYAAVRQQHAFFELADRLHRAKSLEDVYSAAFDAIFTALQCDRSSVLLYDTADVMRFVSWRGLSDAYRQATDGHSPWKPDQVNAAPICMSDVASADLGESLKAVILSEGIQALAFIPLVSHGRLIGKFMVYYDAPHAFSPEETEVALTIARQLAFGIERKRADQEVRQGDEAQYRLAAIVESSEDAIVSKNLDGIITSWNSAAQRIFGFTPDEAVGRSISIIIPPELQDEEKHILSRLRAGERIEHFETIRQTKDGRRRHVWLTISPVRDSSGRVIGASKIARDVTERKQIEQVLKEAELSGRLLQLQDEERRHLARELHDSVGQLLAALSMNIAKISTETKNLSPEAAQCVRDNGALIAQVSAEIRTLSHLLHPPLLDEIGLSSALSEYVNGYTERSNVRVTLDVPKNFPRLPHDYELSLFRIVQECLTNVHRHSGSSTAHIRLSRSADEIHLEVSDQGKGISTEDQEKFVAGRSSGVGLRGMRERVRQLGGTLQIECLGKGTSVQVELPDPEKAHTANKNPGPHIDHGLASRIQADRLHSDRTDPDRSHAARSTESASPTASRLRSPRRHTV
jgi:PAS domain S-box-containing protein